MFTISKEFHFSASHVLKGLPDGHPCGRLHGHNYVLILTLTSPELNNQGFVQDYGELKRVKEWVDTFFDHQHLNEKIAANPTAENIAAKVFKKFEKEYPLLTKVTVKETPKTMASYERKS